MFEDSFIGLLRQYPDAVSERKRFFALMKDYFPEQPMQVNLINTTYDLGIVEELNKAASIGNALAFRFVKRLIDEYGVSRINADWAVSVWCVCYGRQMLGKACDIEISKAKAGAAPAIRDESSAGGKQYNDLFRYRAVSDGYGISGFTGGNIRTLIFPNSYNGKPVTRILANTFEGCDVQEIVMTDGITVIEEAAFKNCKQLKQLILPASLREIGDAAFAGCSQLGSAAMPGKLEQIGRYAFKDTAMKQITLPDSLLWIGDGAFMNCRKLSGIQFPGNLEVLPKEIFKGCSTLKKLTLPAGLTEIGAEAFSGCSSLLDMIIPERVAKVGDNAFAGMDLSFSLICTQRSAAEQYARNHNVPFQIVV